MRNLHDRIFPLRLARSRASIHGQLALARLERLRASLLRDEGEVQVHLEFGEDEAGVPCVLGRVSGELELACQRCLEPVRLEMASEVCLAIVAPDAPIEALDPRYEPLEVGEGPASLSALVEDELILALPFTPAHREGECAIAPEYRSPAAPDQEGRTRPFAALSAIKDLL